jgi:hypothetical protein
MRKSAITVIVIIAVSAALFIAMRRDNRADAAASNCYAAAQGPSSPMICQ